jgi:hypothetical protein
MGRSKCNLVIGLYDPDKPEPLPVASGPEQNGLALLEVLRPIYFDISIHIEAM